MAAVIDQRAGPDPKSGWWEALARPPVAAALLAIVGILAVHADTAASMVSIWSRSETFAHGFLVVPIALWLAWRKRGRLAATPARPAWWMLAAVLASGALWAVAAIGEVQVVRQFALVLLVQTAIVAVVGVAVGRALGFALAFLLFCVPFGEFLVPTLIERTADFTVAALRVSGIPVYREGNYFLIPSGAWSVVEACSGLRYLIASVMVGVLFAAIAYRSTKRRIAFVAASVIVPLLANWVRAYLIVMAGHLSGNKLAVGIDHLIYGWVFFGVVMVLLFWIGMRWAQDEPPAPARSDAVHTTAAPAVPPLRYFLAALVAIGIAAAWRAAPAAVDARLGGPAHPLPSLAAASGWEPLAAPPSEWRPAYRGAADESRQGFARGALAAGIHVGHYRNQTQGREMVTSLNQLVSPEDPQWRMLRSDRATIDWLGTPVSATRIVVRGPGRPLVAYRFYWIDGRVTGSDLVARAWLTWSRLTGHGDAADLVVVFAPELPERDAARDWLADYAPTLDAALRARRNGTP